MLHLGLRGKAKLKLSVPVDSLRTGIAARDEHLRSEHWMHAARYPAITFSGTATKTDARNVAAIESDLSDAELATFSCSYTTAEGMLVRAGVGAGDTVLVPGASGGVGGALVQLAKRRGARVIAMMDALPAEPATYPGDGDSPAAPITLTITPAWRSRMTASIARHMFW